MVDERRLLLVEDSGTMRRMIASLLGAEGFAVTTAADGVEALEKAREVVPDLILTDSEMPRLDGPGLCRAIKQDRELRAVPVVLLTTRGTTDGEVNGLDSGADDYLEKPLTS